MAALEVKRTMKQISDSPHYIDYSKKIPEVVKSGFDTSWITKMFINLEKVVLKSLNIEDPEEMKLMEKLQRDLFEQKMVSKDLRRQLVELKEEQK